MITKEMIAMTRKVKFKIASINTLKITAFKWNMTAWERKFVEDILLSEYVYRGITEKQYNIFSNIASKNDFSLSAFVQSATDEYAQYEGVINQLKAAINANKPIALGTTYDFSKHNRQSDTDK